MSVESSDPEDEGPRRERPGSGRGADDSWRTDSRGGGSASGARGGAPVSPGDRAARVLAPAILALVLLSLLATRAADFAADAMWFSSEGYGATFWRLVGARLGTGATFGAVCFAILFGNAARALSRGERPAPVMVGSDSPARLLRRRAYLLAAGFALLVSAVVGLGASSLWSEALLAIHRRAFGEREAALGHDAGFYVFLVPFLHGARGWVQGVLCLAGLQTIAIYAALGAFSAPLYRTGDRVVFHGFHVAGPARRHLASLAAAILVLAGARFLLARYDLLSAQRALMAGPGYADARGRLPLLLAPAAACFAGAALAWIGIARARMRPILHAIVLFLVFQALASVWPSVVQRFGVAPNEFNREREYLARHIAATRVAWGIDDVEERALTGEATLTRDDVARASDTLANIRVWDRAPLLESLAQVQEIRTYYEFQSVDEDRYRIDGRLRQTVLSPRELSTANLPGRSWINERMIYTHGYGVAMGPVDGATEEGLPLLYVKDIPPDVAHPELRIDQPRIYFGEMTADHVYVGTGNREFDHPAGEENVRGAYDGASGIPIGSFWRRAVLALHLRDWKLLLTGDSTPESRALIRRQVVERASRLVPFAVFERDACMVVHEGRLVWMLDGYTTSSRYPYSRAANGVNYMRNSVKAFVDAYDGRATFYLSDPADPIARAWSAAFPGLLRPLDELPAGLRAHLRYGYEIFRARAHLFATYHMRDPEVFYNQEDRWEIPSTGVRTMEPYYVVMRMPGETEPEFVLMLPFTPASRDNLAAWMAARSDGDRYGSLVAFRFPKDRLVYGPAQISARIEQDEVISPQITLWSQQGSEALRGDPMVIPIGESPIFVQPLYLRASSGRIPELKRIIVGYESRIAMAPSLAEALAEVFDGARGPETSDSGGAIPPGGPSDGSPAPADEGPDAFAARFQEMALEARRAWERSQDAVRAGDWATYGREQERMGSLLERLSRLSGPEPLLEDSFDARDGGAGDTPPGAPLPGFSLPDPVALPSPAESVDSPTEAEDSAPPAGNADVLPLPEDSPPEGRRPMATRRMDAP